MAGSNGDPSDLLLSVKLSCKEDLSHLSKLDSSRTYSKEINRLELGGSIPAFTLAYVWATAKSDS